MRGYETYFWETLTRMYAENGEQGDLRKFKNRRLFRHTFRVNNEFIPGCRNCGEILDLAALDWQRLSVMDIGTSMGGFAFVAHQKGAKRVVGIDRSKTMIRFARHVKREVYGISGPSPEFFCTDFHTFRKCSRESFDLIMAFAVHLYVPVERLCRFADLYGRKYLLFQTHTINEDGLDPVMKVTPDVLARIISAWSGFPKYELFKTYEYKRRGGEKSILRYLIKFERDEAPGSLITRGRRAGMRMFKVAP